MDLNILRQTDFLILERSALALFSLTERSSTGYFQLRFVSIFTPSYLTIPVGYSLLPHNLLFNHLILLRFKDYRFSFSMLSEILFPFKNQLTRCFRSALISLFSFLIKLLGCYRLVSSAK